MIETTIPTVMFVSCNHVRLDGRAMAVGKIIRPRYLDPSIKRKISGHKVENLG